MSVPTRFRASVRAAVLSLLGVALMVPTVHAATVEPSRQIGTSSAQNPTMGIPRWKGWIHPEDPNRMWVSFAGHSSTANNMVYTSDAGLTWSTNIMNIAINGYMDYHLSLFGKGGDLFFTFPGDQTHVRRYAAPATSDDDRLPLELLEGTTDHRSNVMVDGNGRVWVFTRLGGAPEENVRYQYSDDDGQTWTRGTVVATGSYNVRIGSMPYVDGRACVVILHLSSPRGYEYYLWNGSAFEARDDYSIHAEYVGYERAFAHNVVNGRTFHLVYATGNELRHAWKVDQGGSGSWNEQVIDSHSVMDAMSWSPSLTTRGSELYLFYSRWQTTDATSQIYVRRLVDGSGDWEDPVQVSLDGLTYNTHPNTAFSVPVTADYIPVFWTSGPAQDSIRFTRIIGSGVPVLDTTPPAGVKDLEAVTQAASDLVYVQWSATGDDEDVGQATSYDMRYSDHLITDLTWENAIPLDGEPIPAPAGEPQFMLINGLVPGTNYLIGLRVTDDSGNDSELSNIVWARVGSISHASRVPHDRAVLDPNSPNPFNPRTRIGFTLPRSGMAHLAIYDAAGRRIARLLDEWRPEGSHGVVWDGRDKAGRAVASGTYYSRLQFDGEVTTRALTLVR